MMNAMRMAGIGILLGLLAGCGDSGPSADDIAQAYIAHPAGCRDCTYSNWKVIQCKESGGSAAFECDFAFRFLEGDRTSHARFLNNGGKWVMSDLTRH